MMKMPVRRSTSVAPAAVPENRGDAFGVDALDRIVAIAKKMDAIGEATDRAVVPLRRCASRKSSPSRPSGESRRAHAADSIDNVDSRGMGDTGRVQCHRRSAGRPLQLPRECRTSLASQKDRGLR